MQQAGYHHASMLASQLRVGIGNQQTEMLAMVKQFVMGQLPELEDEEQAQPDANAAIEENLQLQMLQMLQILQAMKATQNGNPQGGGNQGGNKHRNRNPKTPENVAFPQAYTSKYCWIHGMRNHETGACNRKASDTGTWLQRRAGWEVPMHFAS